jgi:hypothetical protein
MGLMSLCVRIARVTVLVGILGLLPGILPAAASAGSCPNEELRAEQGDQRLPDCRAYELVTPSEKAGTEDLDFAESKIAGSVAVASSGERLFLEANSFLGANPSHDGVRAVFSRTASGWQETASLQTPNAGEAIYFPEVWNPELTMFGTAAITQSSTSNYVPEETFGVGQPGGPYETMATERFIPGENLATLDATSPDFSHLVLESANHTLAPGGAGTLSGAENVYEWSSAAKQFQLVNVTSAGSLINDCGAEVFHAEGGGYKSQFTYLPHVISDDSSKIFFNAPQADGQFRIEGSEGNPSCKEPSQLYMRIDGHETVEVSAPEPGVTDPMGSKVVEFVGATADGSKVWFTTPNDLTADDNGQHHVEYAWKLYEYNTVTRRLVHVSRGESSNTEEELDVPGQITISEDGSTVYFVAKAELTAAAIGIPPGNGDENIYRYDTETGQLTYVATAKSGRHETFSMFTNRTGSALVFESFGFAAGPGGVVLHEAEDTTNQVYRYDSTTESVKCITCPPKGISSLGGSFLPVEFGEGVYYESMHPLSEDGKQVFFESNVELVSQDTNGPGLSDNEIGHETDVYEWEASGSGSCTSPEGCISLISSGTNDLASSFMGASADGSNVFFSTHSALVPQDQDTYGDLYDARVNGGFAAASAPAACEGESCRLIGSAPPVFGTPQSVAFSGAGNPVALTAPVKHKKVVKKKQQKKKSKKRKSKGRKARRGHVSARKANRRGR